LNTPATSSVNFSTPNPASFAAAFSRFLRCFLASSVSSFSSAMAYLFNSAGRQVTGCCMYALSSHWQAADMRLQSDVDALAAIEEDAKAMLKRIGLPDDAVRLEIVVFLREVIDLASYMESAHRLVEAPSFV
jgi:hypothetical protein